MKLRQTRKTLTISDDLEHQPSVSRRSVVTAAIGASVMVASTTLGVTCAVVKFDIIYNLNGGNNPERQLRSIDVGKSVLVSDLQTPTRHGYNFSGWYLDEDLTTEARELIGAPEETQRTLYAKWEPISYNITYELAGGNSEADLPSSYTIETDSLDLPTPAKEQYDFAGWFVDEAHTTPLDGFFPGSTGDIVLYAAWKLLSYWEEHLQQRCAYINELIASAGQDGDAFIFITDVHMPHNNRYSPLLIDRIVKDCSINKVFCGGDIINWNKDKQEASSLISAWYDSLSQESLYPIRGNHDSNSQNVNSSEENVLNDSELASIVFKGISSAGSDGFYYCLDNNKARIRYVVLDSGSPSVKGLSDAQLNWLQVTLEELDESWSAIVFVHMFYYRKMSQEIQSIELTAQGKRLQGFLDSCTQTTVDPVIALITGHSHNDVLNYSEAGYPIVSTTCDAGGSQASPFDMNWPERTPGTIAEQCFDVMVINKQTRQLDIVRIGCGADRSAAF